MSSSWRHPNPSFIRIHSSSFPSLPQSTSYSLISPECKLTILCTSSLHFISLNGDYILNACSFSYKPSFLFYFTYYIRGNLLWCLHWSWTCSQQSMTVPCCYKAPREKVTAPLSPQWSAFTCYIWEYKMGFTQKSVENELWCLPCTLYEFTLEVLYHVWSPHPVNKAVQETEMSATARVNDNNERQFHIPATRRYHPRTSQPSPHLNHVVNTATEAFTTRNEVKHISGSSLITRLQQKWHEPGLKCKLCLCCPCVLLLFCICKCKVQR